MANFLHSFALFEIIGIDKLDKIPDIKAYGLKETICKNISLFKFQMLFSGKMRDLYQRSVEAAPNLLVGKYCPEKTKAKQVEGC